MTPKHEGDRDQSPSRHELRIALVMNGGVSLAIWMGGVTRELDRVRREDGLYGELLRLTEHEARIDVIAGASAGGINGAVLALAIARGNKVDDVRELWMEDGDIAALLRDPRKRDAPSVMQGDVQLLSKLHEALAKLGGTGAPESESSRPPLHLSITGTIPEGEVTNYRDAFGVVISDVTNRALFRFRRPGVPWTGEDWPDDFTPRAAGGIEDVPAAQLALAARSSASFPVAFEPSWVSIGSTRDELHPDMGEIADFDSGRWVIDGGVLVNTPIEQALDGIKALPAERPVRRVLGYVVPDPAAPSPLQEASMPTALDVVKDAMSRLPRVQSVGRELAEIKDNNENVRRRRETRQRVLGRLQADTLLGLATPLLPAYAETRSTAAAQEIARLLVRATGSRPAPSAAQLAELTRSLQQLESAPWMPATEPREFDLELVTPWKWGLAPIENAANLALQVLRDARPHGERAPERDETPEPGQGFAEMTPPGDGVEGLRRDLHVALGLLRRIEQEHIAFWQTVAESLFPDEAARPTLDQQSAERLAVAWEAQFQSQLERLALRIAAISSAAGMLWRRGELRVQGPDRHGLGNMLDALDGPSDIDVLLRLLALDVIQRSAGADLEGVEQAVELVLMSANANTFGRETKATSKLAGLQAHHFGAFYKASWRANDWMWGRLDGADRLVRTLLDPTTVKHRLQAANERDGQLSVDQALAEIRHIACRQDGSEEAVWLEQEWSNCQCDTAVREELVELSRSSEEPQPTALANSYAAICRRAQLEIVRSELPKVAEAVTVDRQAGAAANSLGCQWQRKYFDEQQPAPSVLQTLTAFEECRIGQETIATETGSRRFMKVSTKGVAATGSLLAWTVARVKLLKPLELPLAILRRTLIWAYRLGRLVPPRD